MNSYTFSEKLQKKVKEAASISSSAYQLYPEQISSDSEQENPSFKNDKDYVNDEQQSSQKEDYSDKEQSSQSQVYVVDGQEQEQIREYLLQKKSNKNKRATQKNESCLKAKNTRRSKKNENNGEQFPETENKKKKKKNCHMIQNSQQSKQSQRNTKNSRSQPTAIKTSHQSFTISKIPEMYVPLNFSLIFIKEKLTGNEQFLEKQPNKETIEKKSSQNIEPTALENSDLEEHFLEVQNENSIKNTVTKRSNLRSHRKEISCEKLQKENQKSGIIQNQDKMKRLDQIGLNSFQKKQVKSMIEEFMLENIEALAKNVEILIAASHQRQRKQIQEQQKSFSAPRKRVKLTRQNNEAKERDNQIQIIAEPPQSTIKNPFQNNAAKKFPKMNSRETRKTQQTRKNTTLDKEKILQMIDEKVDLIQRANPKLQKEESFKKAIVAEALKLVHEIGIMGALEEEIIVEWIKRKSIKQQQKFRSQGRASIKS